MHKMHNMKQSIFNNYIPLQSGAILGYNAMTRRFAVFSDNPQKLLEDSNSTEFSRSDDYQRLVDGGFLIENDIDEKKILQDEIREIDFNDKLAELHINPTLDCNFRCWYCYEEHQKGSEMSLEVLDAVKKYLDKALTAPLTYFRLSFFGGEPLLKFDTVCRPIIMYADTLCKQHDIHLHVSFTTNSYLLTPEITDFLSGYDCGMQITLDGHREFHNRLRFASGGIGSYDKIISNVAMLANAGINIVLRINYTLGNIDSVGEIVTDISLQHITVPGNISVDFQRVWQDKHNGGEEKVRLLISEYGRRLKDIGIRYSLPDLHNPRMSSCYGDKANYVCINYNGDFFKCTARDFKRENRAGYLAPDGSLVWDSDRKETWEEAKFTNPVCHNCRIAPICLGGCRQRNLESMQYGQCPMGYDEARKDDLILQRFEHQYLDA